MLAQAFGGLLQETIITYSGRIPELAKCWPTLSKLLSIFEKEMITGHGRPSAVEAIDPVFATFKHAAFCNFL